MIPPSYSRAFTLIELLISIAVLAVIVTIIVSSFSAFNRSAAVKSAAQITLSALEEARTKTLASQNESVYGVHFESDAVILFRGSVYNDADPENERSDLPTTVTIDALVLEGGGDEVVFERLSGATAHYGTITLVSTAASSTKLITIEATGIAHD